MKSKLLILGALAIVAIVASIALFNQNSCDAQSCPQAQIVDSASGLSAIEDNLKSGAILVDVRTPEEYVEYHAKGSINLPYDQILNGEYPTDNKDTKIYLYCRSGNRASQAQEALENAGYSNIENLQSLNYWQSIGGQLE